MINKGLTIILILLLTTINVKAMEYGYIEVYDINQDKVIKTVQSDEIIQRIAESYLNEIDGIYAKFNPIPKSGYGIRIPLSPAASIKNKWMNSSVNEEIIMLPEGEPPFLMVFDSNDNLLCFSFKDNIKMLLSKLDFKN